MALEKPTKVSYKWMPNKARPSGTSDPFQSIPTIHPLSDRTKEQAAQCISALWNNKNEKELWHRSPIPDPRTLIAKAKTKEDRSCVSRILKPQKTSKELSYSSTGEHLMMTLTATPER